VISSGRRNISTLEVLDGKTTRLDYRADWAGIESSVGSVGDSYANALAETIIGLFKTEVIWQRGPWKTIDEVEYAVCEWVDWFNNRRLLESIGDIPPADFEQAYYEQPHTKESPKYPGWFNSFSRLAIP